MAFGFDAQAEQQLLAAMMQKKEYLLDIISSLKSDDFTEPSNKAMFNIIKAMADNGEDVNPQSVMIKHKEEIAELNFGRSFILMATDFMEHQAVEPLIQRTKENTSLRRLLVLSDTVRRMIKEGDGSADIYETVEKAVIDRTSDSAGRTYVTPEDMATAGIEAMFNRLDEATRKKNVLYSRFKKLNYITGGFDKGDLVILSAESGAGKSAFAMNLSRDIGITQKRGLLYLNSEMSTEQMALRWDSYLAGVSHSDLRMGKVSQADQDKVQAANESLYSSKLYTVNIPDLQIANVLAEVRRSKERYGVEMAIVDYIGRMDTMNDRDAKEWQVLLNAARQLKTLAQELGIVVVMVAQLTSDGGRLAQGSYMKHEADLWLNIKRFSDEEEQKLFPWNATIEFRKARNAETGCKLLMHFCGDILTFTDDEKEAQALCALERPTTGPEQFGKAVPCRQR